MVDNVLSNGLAVGFSIDVRPDSIPVGGIHRVYHIDSIST